MRAKNILNEEDALRAAGKHFALLMAGRLANIREKTQSGLNALGLTEAQRRNLDNVHHAMSGTGADYEEKTTLLSQFLNGDVNLALSYSLLEDMKGATEAMALSKAEDLNDRLVKAPYLAMRRQREKKDGLDTLREHLVEDIATLGGVGQEEAKLCLRRFEQAVASDLKGLAGQTRGVGG